MEIRVADFRNAPDSAIIDAVLSGRTGRQIFLKQLWRVARGRLAAEGSTMAAMKPRTGDGPLEVTKEGRSILLRMPLEGGGRLVVEMNADEAAALGDAIKGCIG